MKTDYQIVAHTGKQKKHPQIIQVGHFRVHEWNENVSCAAVSMVMLFVYHQTADSDV
jgi:uncharacterized protein YsxB (DUF464 family)